MTNDNDRLCEAPARRSASGKWIVLALVSAIAGVLAVKQAERSKAAGAVSPVSKVQPAAATAAAQTQPLPRLVDVGAGKCIPCKMMAPILEDLRRTYAGKLEVVFVDVWENPQAGEPYGIQTIPTQIFYDAQGKERFRHEGFFAKAEILAKWKELGVELPP